MRFRFSGHESFPCRYTWLPKAYNALTSDPYLFQDDKRSMVTLGLGKNMVLATKFWIQAFGIARLEAVGGMYLTSFGNQLFSENGLDPFLEDIKTMWLLHWKVSTIKDDPLFAWYYMLNQWREPNFSRSEILNIFTRESDRMDRPLSDFTKGQHFDIFLHTYLPVQGRRQGIILEDSLDCPLTELRFIHQAGERDGDYFGRKESVYEFRQDNKSEITGALFVYCLFDYWRTYKTAEASLAFHELSVGSAGPGQIFKISEPDLRTRLESAYKESHGIFEYHASAAVPRVTLHANLNDETESILLNRVYEATNITRQEPTTKNTYAN